MVEIVKFEENKTTKICIDLTQKIAMQVSKFPIQYINKKGERGIFYPMQTVFTLTNGAKIYANSFLSADITDAIMKNARTQDTATFNITKTGTGTETRYKVEFVK